jgi:hypothetical protein
MKEMMIWHRGEFLPSDTQPLYLGNVKYNWGEDIQISERILLTLKS